MAEVRKEVGFLRRLRHQNVVSFFEDFQFRRYICIVMEFCDGGTLRPGGATHSPLCQSSPSEPICISLFIAFYPPPRCLTPSPAQFGLTLAPTLRCFGLSCRWSAKPSPPRLSWPLVARTGGGVVSVPPFSCHCPGGGGHPCRHKHIESRKQRGFSVLPRAGRPAGPPWRRASPATSSSSPTGWSSSTGRT